MQMTAIAKLSPMLVVLSMAAPAGAQVPRPQPAKAGLDPAKLPALRAELQKFVDEGQIAGAVTVIGRRGHIGSLEVVGFRDREAETPMKADTVFRIASMTKIATSVAVMMLEEAGKFSVDDPVEKHLPEFRGQKLLQTLLAKPGSQPAEKPGDQAFKLAEPARKITIKDLMTHTSGMHCQNPPGFGDLGQKKDRTLTEAVIAFSQQPLDTQPGSLWKYCGTSFDTLGRLVEVASGKSFEAFLNERVFRPLKMKDTTFRLSPTQRQRLAVNYKRDSEAPGAKAVRSESQGPGPDNKVIYTSPSGGLYSTAADYSALMQMLVDKGKVPGGRALLKPETVTRMTSVHFKPPKPGDKVGFSPGLGMGLGVQVVMTPAEVTEALSPGSFGHGGAHGTQAWADPVTGAYYVLMIQRQGFGNGDQSDVRRALQKLGSAALTPSTAALDAAAPQH
jgi:CubicO group peptidase (beta-lactamase class C family)